MPYCSKCGSQNLETAKFCVNCGAPLQAVANEQVPVQPSSPSFVPAQTSGIGSKVSFVASDGKSYTGTITDIKGDQYKIKYDAYDFETWLGKSQFTIIGASTPLPVYTAPPTTVNPPVTYTNTSSSAATTAAPGMGIITHLGFWGSILILVGFFTDWINQGVFAGNVTGFTFTKAVFEHFDALENELVWIMFTVILVIVISAIICMLYILGVGIGRGAFAFFKILPLLAIIGFIVYCVIKAKEAGVDPDLETNTSAWKILGIGIYLTLGGSLLLAISRSRK